MKKTSIAIFAAFFLCFIALGFLVYRVTTKEEDYTKIIYFTEGTSYGEDNKFYNNCWNSVNHFSLEVPVEGYANPEKKPVAECLKKILKEKPGLVVINNENRDLPGLEELVKENPKTQFILLDKEYPIPLPNYRYLTIDVEQASMLAGYAAAKMTKTGKIGFVGGKDLPEIDAFKYGFMAGITFGSHELNKDIKFEAAYIGNYQDEKRAAELARELYSHDCDIIFQVAGNAGHGVIAEAEKEGHFAIGVDDDQYSLSPQAVLTSVIKDWDLAIFDVVNDYLHSNLLPAEKSAVKLDLAGNYCRLPYSNPNIPYEIRKDIDNLSDLITSGYITVPNSPLSYDLFLETRNKNRESSL
jgi:basic membrane protein A